ncbi:hypothetical protein PZ897_01875 [Hoeflea sp. YIM 152468]|uniref:hypothetical protein n=1 Tax=Hoeflea sp. YIM 152468 TaxID=3031759 RepID=UPI0023DA918F|nr:hypothetical protein [Hoeflea sp. YIM 152468]MDF1606918.1 hypothetical protein [Hoeflea sp. YIM 152468]
MSTPAPAIAHRSVFEAIAIILSRLNQIGRELEIQLTDAASFKRDRLESVLQTNQAQMADLAAFLDRHGYKADEPAPQEPLVDEGVARIRALLSSLDINILPDIAAGQRSLLSTYDDALEAMMECGGSLDDMEMLRGLLRTHRRQLEQIIADLAISHRGVADHAANESRA